MDDILSAKKKWNSKRPLCLPNHENLQTTTSIRQSDGTFDGNNIVLWATPLDSEHPGRKTVARAHLEEDGHLLLHRHFLIDDKGKERMIIELRMTRK